jgi:signal transduction histidine kinase
MVSEQCKHKSIILDFKPEEERFSVTGNIYKFEQVILNLIKNSIDALEEKKHIYNTGFEMKILVRSFYKNNSIIVTVEDNGIGVSESNIEYIMHPFYTTKESGKGTGLGLSISYGIIKEMNGDIKIKSVPMNGTCIIITLPSNSN